MSDRVSYQLNFAQKAALAFAAMAVVNAPAIKCQSAAAAATKFEVASIKPCTVEDNGGRGPGKAGGGSGGFGWTPGRLDVRCATLESLIRDAYLSYPEGKQWVAATRAEPTPDAFGVHNGGCLYCGRGVAPVSSRLFHEPIQGSPDWAKSDRYSVDAKTDGPATPEMMRGPMMQALLEERFQLKIHRESREIPVYELTVAKGGPKLQAATDASCITGPSPSSRLPVQAPPRICGRGVLTEKGGTGYPGNTIAQFCSNLSGYFDRDVVDKTGITGVFDIHVDARRADLPDLSTGPPADGAPPPAIQWDRVATFKLFQAALPKIGLKLEPAKGVGVFLVIDHVERPSGN
jgi:uncharacterized protein (TIGR03435 family)